MANSNKLNPLQMDFLNSWFKLTTQFFLTGGGALAGFYGSPRLTKDLDLFTVSREAFSIVPALIHDVCLELSASAVALQTAPHFRRFRLERGEETTLLDFVEDLAPQVCAEKVTSTEGFILDPPQEIAVNKICAMVSRSEPRDFFDFHYLVEQGQNPETLLELANRKDSGVDAEALVMILQSIPWEHYRIRGVESQATAAFFSEWLERLTLALHPGVSPLPSP